MTRMTATDATPLQATTDDIKVLIDKAKSPLVASQMGASIPSMFQQMGVDVDVETIHEIVISALNEYHYFINDYSLVNLLLHVTIAIHRIENCCNVVPSSGAASLIRAHEYEVAKKITDALEAAFGVHFAQGESYDIALMLISRASSMDYQSISVENISLYVGEKCWQLVQKLVMAVRDYYDIDLSQQEFLVRFSLHIKNLLTRSENHSYCQNPLTSDIKGNCPLIYDVAVQLAGIIREQTGLTIDDDEIAFIAFHLGGALETQRALASRISAVLYCPSYYNMDAALYEKLNGRFREELVVTNVVTREQDIKKIQGVELIIATVPLHAPMTIPRVMITPFLTETNCFDISCYIKNIKEDQRRRMFRENLCTMLRSVQGSPLVILYARPEIRVSQSGWLASHMAWTAFS